MATFNRVILLGNITRDIELRHTQGGTAVTDIGLAVNDRRKHAQTEEWIEETSFVDVTLWGRTAEVAHQYLGKGSAVLIEGRIKQDRWEDKDGNKRQKLRVIAEKMQMLGSGKGQPGGSASQSQGQPSSSVSETEGYVDIDSYTNPDIPF